MKTALITGVSGQDGSYLAEHLLRLDYRVYGIVRYYHFRSKNLPPFVSGHPRMTFLYGDVRDKLSLEEAIRKSQPDEIYNLAGQTFVPISWCNAPETFDVNVGGLARILEIVERVCPSARVYQASSSEMYGNYNGALDEDTPMHPVSPYGVSKFSSHCLAKVYRAKGMYVSCGILFNHESPRRGPEMVTRKITRHIAAWMAGSKEPLCLGNLKARRDWGFAGDYVKAMHTMLQMPLPDDFVIGTGTSHSVIDFVQSAIVASKLDWDEYASLIESDPLAMRANEIHDLVAKPSKAHNILDWWPRTTFEELVKMMVDHDAALVSTEARV